jgi:hypothetical protein
LRVLHARRVRLEWHRASNAGAHRAFEFRYKNIPHARKVDSGRFRDFVKKPGETIVSPAFVVSVRSALEMRSGCRSGNKSEPFLSSRK